MPDADAGNRQADCRKAIFPGRFDEVFETGGIEFGEAEIDFIILKKWRL